MYLQVFFRLSYPRTRFSQPRLFVCLRSPGWFGQAARAAQFEKEDVLKNYRGLHAEKRRLEAGIDELQLTRQRLTKVRLARYS